MYELRYIQISFSHISHLYRKLEQVECEYVRCMLKTSGDDCLRIIEPLVIADQYSDALVHSLVSASAILECYKKLNTEYTILQNYSDIFFAKTWIYQACVSVT